MLIERIRTEILDGTPIPKPEAKGIFVVKGWAMRRGEPALIYKIPSRRDPLKHYEKGITVSEFKAAYAQLVSTGSLTRRWFNNNLQDCAREGSCNFTSVGGIFILLGLVKYVPKAAYERL